MPARKREADESKYVARNAVQKTIVPVTTFELALKVPKIVMALDNSVAQQARSKPDWSKYKVKIENDVAYIVREYCGRCGKVFLYPAQRKLRVYVDADVGHIYLDEGVCKDCNNTGVYVDKYLRTDLSDSFVPTEAEAKKLFTKYTHDYEKAWRMVIAAAPRIAMTEQEWIHRCSFFGGCAMCGGPIEVQAKFFPVTLNGTHSAWNIIPLCSDCYAKHKLGRGDVSKKVAMRYKVFSTHEAFQKTKTIRMYLLAQMEKHNLYIEPLQQYRTRFFETKTLEGSK